MRADSRLPVILARATGRRTEACQGGREARATSVSATGRKSLQSKNLAADGSTDDGGPLLANEPAGIGALCPAWSPARFAAESAGG